ncbi:ABC transporter ATP-binding protein [Mesorhizobium sp. 10J20-29]
MRESIPPNLNMYILSLICVLALASSTSGLALAMRYIVNNIFVNRNSGQVLLIAAAIVALSFIKGLATYFQTITVGHIRRTLVTDFQVRQFSKLVSSELRFFGTRHSTEFVSDLLYAARGAASAVLTLTNNLIRDLLTLVFLVGVMISQDPMMSLCTIVILPVVILALSFVVKRLKKLANQQVQLNAQVSAVATEVIAGIKVIKSFGLEERAQHAFRKSVIALERSSLKINRVTALTSPIMETLGGVVIGLFVLYASWQTLGNERTPGEYMAFITAFIFAYEPAKRIAGVNVDLQKQLVAVDRLYQLLDRPGSEADTATQSAGAVQISKGSIEFRNVSFFYNPGESALHDVSFRIQSGERVAIVGRSGSGKTTAINLMLGFLTPDSGAIMIDGHDITRLRYDSLRRGISLIAQDVFLFGGTIRENIRDGDPKADRARIEQAAEDAHVTAFSEQLPLGLDTPVGPNGSFLSGGQRQRVSIARAIVKDAPILVYDEATSALDGESERVVMSASQKNNFERTVICIAHRLSTIRTFDRIIVLDKGRVIDSGTYGDLTKRNETFRSIFHIGEPDRSAWISAT